MTELMMDTESCMKILSDIKGIKATIKAYETHVSSDLNRINPGTVLDLITQIESGFQELRKTLLNASYSEFAKE
jgi:hypothetical protein